MRPRRQISCLLVLIVLVSSANPWPNAKQDHDEAGDSEKTEGTNETTVDEDDDHYPDGNRVNDTDDADTEAPIISRVSLESILGG